MELRTDRYTLKDLIHGNKEKGLAPIKETNPTKAQELGKYAQKLHRKLDDIVFIRKGIPIDPKDISIKEGERAAIRLISTANLDRDGEILIPKGVMLDDFRQAPSVLYAHDYKGLPIGSDQWIKIVPQGILAKTAYARHQFAEDVYQCVKDKHLRSNSVGFIPVEAVPPEEKKRFEECQDILEKEYDVSREESGKATAIYAKWILLEHSDVPVASNAQSLNIAVSKGILNLQSERLKKDLEVEIVKDEDIIILEEHDPDKSIPEEKIKRDDGIIEVELDAFTEEEKEEIDYRVEKGKEAIAELRKEGKITKIITKPETPADYHRIPVESPDKHKGHRIRTITISAPKGIKALYCGECKKVITYLFDVEKWSMARAQAWVKENHKKELEEYIQKIMEGEPQYKERWNKSFSKLFDVASTQSPTPLRFHYQLYEKFLECKVKEIFQNGYSIPGPLLGTYLAGFKKMLGEFDLKDTRKFVWDGSEVPPNYEVIQLNSQKSDDFLIDGMCFYEGEKKPLIVNFSPDWYGLTVTLTTSNGNKEWNKQLLDKVHGWVYENNFLRGEKFSLSGEFLHEPDDDWDNLILDERYKDSIRKSANFLEKKGKNFTARGLLFIGPPGTGKTKTGRVLMNELDATFIWVSSKDFRHIGPLRALVLGFSLARNLAPSVLFLEDIDTWLRGEMEYVTDLIKTEMEGINQHKGIITILTSNYPEKLPDALLDRPGRFHHIVKFELPKKELREEMLKMWAGDIGEELLKEITEKTDGFSGAHIKELVEFARMIAEEDEIEIGEALLKSLEKLMEQRELIEEIRANNTEVKALWGRVKYEKGEVKIMEDKSIEIETEIKAEQEKKKYNCECIKCKHKMESDKHCNEIKCPKCGGEMRRAERPGPGKEKKDICEHTQVVEITERDGKFGRTFRCFNCDTEIFVPDGDTHISQELKELKDAIGDLKEGRVLSGSDRKVIETAIEALRTALKTVAGDTEEEPEEEIEIVEEKSEGEEEPDMEAAVKEAVSKLDLKDVIKEAVQEDLDKKRGKVK